MIGTVLEAGLLILMFAVVVGVGGLIGFIFGDMAERGRIGAGVGAGIGLFVFVCIAYFSVQGPDDWERLCAGAGGRVESTSSSNTTVAPGPNGTIVPVTTTSSSDFCVTPDGRLLGAR